MYVLLEIDDTDEAGDLQADLARYPGVFTSPLRGLGYDTHARVVYVGQANPIHDECDTRGEDK